MRAGRYTDEKGKKKEGKEKCRFVLQSSTDYWIRGGWREEKQLTELIREEERNGGDGRNRIKAIPLPQRSSLKKERGG